MLNIQRLHLPPKLNIVSNYWLNKWKLVNDIEVDIPSQFNVNLVSRGNFSLYSNS